MKLLAGLLCAHAVAAGSTNSTAVDKILVAGDSWVRASCIDLVAWCDDSAP